MPRICQTMSRCIQPLGCWALAVLSVLPCFGIPTGLVLCIEDDGSMSIETPAEQAACQHRHELAAACAATQPGFHATGVRGCVDIPLSFAQGAVLHRSSVVRVASIERRELSFIAPSIASSGSPWSRCVWQWSLGGCSPPSSALMALRTVVLLV